MALEFNDAFTGDDPAGTPAWLTAVFENTVANTVQLTLTANLQDPNEFNSNVWFNYSGADASELVFSYVSGILGTFTGDTDQFNGGAGVKYDINGEYPTSNKNPALRFDGADTSVFTIFRAAGLDESDFNVVANSGGNVNNRFIATAHVQGIDGPAGSGHIYATEVEVVPEPASLAVWGCIGLMGIPYGIYRRRKAIKA
ncbi:MAG: hypothetical protein SGJ19_03265 [Planctomycetia bacterium]|nr:hypothetical protein [Planctomycetia bacterium]